MQLTSLAGDVVDDIDDAATEGAAAAVATPPSPSYQLYRSLLQCLQTRVKAVANSLTTQLETALSARATELRAQLDDTGLPKLCREADAVSLSECLPLLRPPPPLKPY